MPPPTDRGNLPGEGDGEPAKHGSNVLVSVQFDEAPRPR